jgi:hypothetical protein
MSKSVVPNFLIVGAAKSGTTLLWNWLSSHPDVFMPGVKEPHFFCFEGGAIPCIGAELDPFYAAQITTNRTSYEALWVERRKNQICGEASPGYLYYPQTARRIAKENPDMRIIAIFRNPIKRAFSQYMHHLRDGFEPCATFEDALHAEEERKEAGFWWGYHYLSAGFYAQQWQHYQHTFPRKQLLPLLYDEAVQDPRATYEKICSFLELTPQHQNFSKHYNQTANLEYVPRHGKLQTTLRNGSAATRMAHLLLPSTPRDLLRGWISWCNSVRAPKLERPSIGKLSNHFKSDINELSKMIGKDLSDWVQI